MTILVVEDEQKLVDILKKALTRERFIVDTALDGEEGLNKAKKNSYEVIILDIMLPRKDGLEVCRELRSLGVNTPIIMLTARGMLEDRVAGLDAGADDYLVKPFGLEELLARIRALSRRKKPIEPNVHKIGDLILDTKKHEVTKSGKIISLTLKEYRILDALVRHRGEVLTRRKLLDEVWGPEFREANHDLNVHMRYLRRKIDLDESKPLIRTVRGVGYILKE